MNTTIKSQGFNQNQLVIGTLKSSRRNLTSEQICEIVNGNLKKNRIKERLTITQVSKCLNRFSEKNMVKQIDQKGEFSNGRKAYRWSYVRTNS